LPLESHLLPVPYVQYSDGTFGIMYPNSDGKLELDYGVTMTLSCPNSSFVIQNSNTRKIDIHVECYEGEFVRTSDMVVYNFRELFCNETPMAVLFVYGQECKGPNTVVAKVGYDTQYAFLPQYGVCFDKTEKISLYTWYEARLPNKNQKVVYDSQPKSKWRSISSELYNGVNVNDAYTVVSQVSTIT